MGVQVVGYDETRLMPTNEDGVYQEGNQVYIQFGDPEEASN